jgi:hypothetical protein
MTPLSEKKKKQQQLERSGFLKDITPLSVDIENQLKMIDNQDINNTKSAKSQSQMSSFGGTNSEQ